jgi:hypothetical protein
MNPEPFINLIVQYCPDPRPQRSAEFDECFRRNLANPWVERVHNMTAPIETTVPEEFRNHPKYVQVPLGKWMRYSDAIDYANTTFPGKIAALSNLDIFLDPASDWAKAKELTRQGIVLSLSRTEFDIDGTTFKDPNFASIAFANTQDVWCFLSPIKVPNCDFETGILGCDNAFNHRLKVAGYLPLNMPSVFQTFHYDRYRKKNATNQSDIHKRDQSHRAWDRHPEREGQYLTPDFDMIKSVDAVLAAVKASDLQKYMVICDVISHFIKIKNP